MLQGLPRDFRCDGCHARQDDALLCREASDARRLYCVQCCTCPVHTPPEDIEGTVIWTWRAPETP